MDLGVGRQLSYQAGRRLLVITGLVVLAASAAVLYARRVESTEVIGVLLFVPVYLAVVGGKLRGGVIAGAVAAVVYGVLRLNGVDAYDRAQRIQLVGSRTLAYLAFGLVGGFAVRQLEAALVKLDRYDLIDDDTGLFNARFAATELSLESARATRYGSSFSVVLVDGPLAPLRSLRRSRRGEALRALGHAVGETVRLVDRAAVGQEGERFLVAVVMPETGRAGAEIVVGRLAINIGAALTAAGATAADDLRPQVLVFPEDADAVGDLRDRFAALDRIDHPAVEPAPA